MDANEHRSSPGYVYGVAVSSSRQEEGTPPCRCACHVADAPDGARGWWCNACHSYLARCSWPEKPPVPYTHEQAIKDGSENPRPYMVMVPDYYFLTRGNSLQHAFPRQRFKTREAAEKAAKRLNDADAIASLDVPPIHKERFDRLRNLRGDRYHWSMDEAHPLTYLPRTPGRYAVRELYDGESSWDTYETLNEVEECVLRGDVWEIVDLDTGDNVPFALSAHIGQEAVAMREP